MQGCWTLVPARVRVPAVRESPELSRSISLFAVPPTTPIIPEALRGRARGGHTLQNGKFISAVLIPVFDRGALRERERELKKAYFTSAPRVYGPGRLFGALPVPLAVRTLSFVSVDAEHERPTTRRAIIIYH